MSEENSGWICCSCGSPNFDDDKCFLCEHIVCGTCEKLTKEKAQQIIEGKEKATAWLIGQEQSRRIFNKETYEKNQKEKQIEEMQEEIESEMESSEDERKVARKKR